MQYASNSFEWSWSYIDNDHAQYISRVAPDQSIVFDLADIESAVFKAVKAWTLNV